MNCKKVSVIIPAYNGEAFVADTVTSVLDQTYPNMEVIVVDDGSRDGTVDVLKGFGDRIRVISQENGGPASARNSGIKAAGGDFIAFCDGDDVWEKEKLARQMDVFEREPDLGLVYTRLRILHDDGSLTAKTGRPLRDRNAFLQLFEHNIIPTSTVVVRKECFEQCGLMDEDRDVISVEDYDMWLRIASRYPLAVIEEPLARYRRHSGGISRNIGRSYNAELKVITTNYARFQNRFPQIRPTWNRRRAQLFFECGYDYFYNGYPLEAREWLWRSIRTRPRHPRAWWYLMWSYVPSGLVKQIKAMKTA